MWNSSSVLYFFWHWHFWVICQLFWRMSLGSDLSDYSLMISFRSCVLTEPPPGWSCVLLSAHYQAAPDVKVASTGFSRFPAGAVIKSPPANAEDARDVGLIPGSGRSPGAGNGNLPVATPVFLPGKSRGQRSPVGYKESDMTWWPSNNSDAFATIKAIDMEMLLQTRCGHGAEGWSKKIG